MAKKRGRPKKLPQLQIKEFDRQFREAPIPAFLVDHELTVVYANDYARTTIPDSERPNGLRALLPEKDRQDCVRRIAGKESFRLALPSVGGVRAAIAVTPVAEEDSDQPAGAMVLITCPDPSRGLAPEDINLAALTSGLRRPISNIFASLSIIGRSTRLVHQERQYDPHLQNISLASYQLLRNVINLTSYHQGRSGSESEDRIEVVDFWERLAFLLDACDIALHDNDIPFRYQLPDKQTVAHVSCCFAEVEMALLNLISNAYCHSRPGNQVEVVGTNISNGVMVTVSDRGRGIEPDQLPHVFDPFYSQGDDKDAFVGMGLGLTVAKQDIQANGGKLVIKSTPGEGTSIAFTLPTCDKPLTPPLVMASGAVQYLRDSISILYIELCDSVTLPPH